MQFIKSGLVPVCALSALLGANAKAETLILEFDTQGAPAETVLPDGFEDLRERFGANPRSGEFTVRVFLPEFERYAEGTHEVSMNVGNGLNWGPEADQDPEVPIAGLAMTLESPTLGQLEGVRTRVRAQNAAGEPVGGAVLLPDESQLADYGTISITDGRLTGFSYGWIESDNPGLVSMTSYLTGRRGLPVGMTSLTIDVSAFTEPARYGDIVLVQGLAPSIQVEMAPVE